MKSHTEIYFKAFGYTTADFIACEICGYKANDIHHISCRGMGGDPTGSKDVIENLQAICRSDHDKYGDKVEHTEFLFDKHAEFMENNGLKPNYGLIDKLKRGKGFSTKGIS